MFTRRVIEWLSVVSLLVLVLDGDTTGQDLRGLTQRTPEGDKAFAGALKSLCWIGATRTKGEGTEQRFRSGVLVDAERRLVVTAFDVDMGEGTKISVLFPKFDGGKLINEGQPYQDDVNGGKGIAARVVAAKPACELAILELDELPVGVAAMPISAAAPRSGQLVYAAYASFQQNEMWNYRPEQVARAGARKWRQDDLDKSLEREPFERSARVIESQRFFIEGQVGGPLVTPRGQLVGITVQIPPDLMGGMASPSLSVAAAEVNTLLAPLRKKAEEDEPVAEKPVPKKPTKPAALTARRTWKDASGKFQIEAELVAVTADAVVLRKADATELTVPIEKLSEADRRLIESRRK